MGDGIKNKTQQPETKSSQTEDPREEQLLYKIHFTEHTVKPGETLAGITGTSGSKELYTGGGIIGDYSADVLATSMASDIKDPNKIKVGQQITVASGAKEFFEFEAAKNTLTQAGVKPVSNTAINGGGGQGKPRQL